MYGVLRNEELVALSEDIEEINQFIDNEVKLLNNIFTEATNEDQYDIILISKQKSKYIKKQTEYDELLLVQCSNGQYVPKRYAYIIESLKEDSISNIRETIQTMIVILQSGILSDKEFKTILKSAKILNKIQSKYTDDKVSLNHLKEIHKMNQDFKERT